MAALLSKSVTVTLRFQFSAVELGLLEAYRVSLPGTVHGNTVEMSNVQAEQLRVDICRMLKNRGVVDFRAQIQGGDLTTDFYHLYGIVLEIEKQ